MGPPVVSRLHPRSATVNWIPPSPLNGIVRNFTICLCHSSVCRADTTISFSLIPNPKLLSNTVGSELNSHQNLRHSSGYMTTESSHILPIKRGSNESSRTIRDTGPSVHRNQRLGPGTTEGNQIEPVHKTNSTQGPDSMSFQPTKPSAASENSTSSLLLSNLYPAASSHMEPVQKKEPFASRVFGCFHAISDSSSYLQSVTIPGNTTSYTFQDLLPYQIYSFQVQYNSLALLFETLWYDRSSYVIVRNLKWCLL